MTKNRKTKMGRPPLSPDQKTDSKRFSVVIPAELAARIERAAENNGNSRNGQVIEWLDQSKDAPITDQLNYGISEVHGICDIIGCLIRSYEDSEHGQLWDDHNSHAELKEAVALLLDCFGPTPGIPSPYSGESSADRRVRSLLSRYRHHIDHDDGIDSQRTIAEVTTLERLGPEHRAKLTDKLEPRK